MWAPGMGELVVILVIVLIIFGAGKLPTVGKSIGGAIKEFKESVTDKEDEKEPVEPTAAQSESKKDSEESEIKTN